ncbi:hypothetical protein Tco_1526118 [Tanacetum coccineum]
MEVGSEEDIDLDVMANIEADITAKAAVADMIKAETKVGFEGDDEAKDETESSTRGTMEIRVYRVSKPEIVADSLEPSSDGGSRENFEIGLDVVIQEFFDHMVEIPIRRITDIEGEGGLVEERERADSIGRCLSYVQEELRQIRSSRYYERMDFRRLKTFAMRRLEYHP